MRGGAATPPRPLSTTLDLASGSWGAPETCRQKTPRGALPPDVGLAATATAWFDQLLAAALAHIAPLARVAEVYSDYNHGLISVANRRAAVRSGLRLTVHGPGEGADVGHPCEVARKAALAVHRRLPDIDRLADHVEAHLDPARLGSIVSL